MVSTRNTSRSNANPPRMQDQPGRMESRPPRGELETVQANTGEMEALRLTNQRLIRELEQLIDRCSAHRKCDKSKKATIPPLRKNGHTSALPKRQKQKQNPAEPGDTSLTYPLERSTTKQYPGGISEMLSRLLFNKE